MREREADLGIGVRKINYRPYSSNTKNREDKKAEIADSEAIRDTFKHGN